MRRRLSRFTIALILILLSLVVYVIISSRPLDPTRYLTLGWGHDTSQKYMVKPVYRMSDTQELSIDNDVTIVTHCSANRLVELLALVDRWMGPISVSVFVPVDQLPEALLVVESLRQCNPSFRQYVTISIVIPCPQTSLVENKMENLLVCSEVQSFVRLKLGGINYEMENISYPNNLLRNVAKLATNTYYLLMLDIDMQPSLDLRYDFLHFVLRSGGVSAKTVFVLPAFEIDVEVVPKYKSELLDLAKSGNVRPFYSKMCAKCQAPTNYDKWATLPDDDLDVGYYSEWEDYWEPFYISVRSVPHYDERFFQYGFNRISQICELFSAEFVFSVLNNAFVVHSGFKTKGSFHSTKDAENDRNRVLYAQFKKDLRVKYNDSKNVCW